MMPVTRSNSGPFMPIPEQSQISSQIFTEFNQKYGSLRVEELYAKAKLDKPASFKGSSPDWRFILYLIAANKGHLEALTQLNQSCIAHDYYFEFTKNHANIGTLIDMGLAFENGWGVAIDDQKALACFEAVLQAPFDRAGLSDVARLKVIKYYLIAGPEKLPAAIEHLNWLADLNHPEALFILGGIYYEKDPAAAFGYYERAAKVGCAKSSLLIKDTRFLEQVGIFRTKSNN